MTLDLTESEVLAAKVAMIRKYIMAKPPKGTRSNVFMWLMKYEGKLEEYFRQEIGEYRHYPGSYWEPPTDELINEENVQDAMEDTINEAMRYESWNDLNWDDLTEMFELMEDFDEVIQAERESRNAGGVC